MTRCARPGCGGTLLADYDDGQKCGSCSRPPEKALAPIPETVRLRCPSYECRGHLWSDEKDLAQHIASHGNGRTTSRPRTEAQKRAVRIKSQIAIAPPGPRRV